MSDEDDPVAGEVICCQGPPVCDLMDDAAMDAQKAGCRWCKRIMIMKDGTEVVTEPTRA